MHIANIALVAGFIVGVVLTMVVFVTDLGTRWSVYLAWAGLAIALYQIAQSAKSQREIERALRGEVQNLSILIHQLGQRKRWMSRPDMQDRIREMNAHPNRKAWTADEGQVVYLEYTFEEGGRSETEIWTALHGEPGGYGLYTYGSFPDGPPPPDEFS
jgi:hypothetical protein